MNVMDRANQAGTALRRSVEQDVDVNASLVLLQDHTSGSRRRAVIAVGVGVAAAVAAGFGVVAVVGDNSSSDEPTSPSPSVIESPNFATPNVAQPVPGTPGAGIRIPISVTSIPAGMQVESDGDLVSIWGDEPLVQGGGAFLILIADGTVHGLAERGLHTSATRRTTWPGCHRTPCSLSPIRPMSSSTVGQRFGSRSKQPRQPVRRHQAGNSYSRSRTALVARTASTRIGPTSEPASW